MICNRCKSERAILDNNRICGFCDTELNMMLKDPLNSKFTKEEIKNRWRGVTIERTEKTTFQ